jgi:hypothetical protein
VETDEGKRELLAEKDVKNLREEVASVTAGCTDLIDLQRQPLRPRDVSTWKG